MKQYKSKPVTVEAIQYTKQSLIDVCLLLAKNLEDLVIKFNESDETLYLIANTSDGKVEIHESDYIIKDKEGKFYQYSCEKFNEEYEEINFIAGSIVGRVCVVREDIFNGNGEEIAHGEECYIDGVYPDDDPFNKLGVTYTITSNNGVVISGVYRDSLELID